MDSYMHPHYLPNFRQVVLAMRDDFCHAWNIFNRLQLLSAAGGYGVPMVKFN